MLSLLYSSYGKYLPLSVLDKLIVLLILAFGNFLKWHTITSLIFFSWSSFLDIAFSATIFFVVLRSKQSMNSRVEVVTIISVILTFLPNYVSTPPIEGYEIQTGVLKLFIFCNSFYLIMLIMSLLTLNKNFSLFPSARGVTSHGPYSLVRHPIYSCYIYMQVMYCFISPSLTRIILLIGLIVGCLIRAHKEESLLCVNQKYLIYREKVKCAIFNPFFAIPALSVGCFQVVNIFFDYQ